MNLNDAKARKDALVERELVILSQLAEMKRAYIVDGIDGDLRERTTLEAELARMAVEKFQTNKALNEGRKAERYRQTETFIDVLVRILNERGMGDVVAEARRVHQASVIDILVEA